MLSARLAVAARARLPARRACSHLVAGLGPEHLELRDTVRRFVEAEIKPLAAQMDCDNEFPMHLWPALGDMGLLGPTVEEEYGGMGMGYLEHCLIIEEIARGSASVALSYGAHSNLCVNQIRLNGTEEQKRRLLPDLVAGRAIGALSMSESGAGSDVVSLRLRADKAADGESFVLNGSKHWCTNAPDAHTFVVYAKTDADAGPRGITAFLVERGTPGFSTGPKLDKLGNRGSNTGELVFEDCEVPAANVLGGEGQGVRVLMSGLDYERAVLAGGALGIMQATMDEVLPYVRERQQFGRPIGTFQLMQGKIADMYAKLQSTRCMQYAMCRALDAGAVDKRAMRKEIAALVLLAGENAVDVALEGIQIHGGNGYTNDFPMGRFLRDAKLYTIGGGTSEVRRMLIGRELFEG